MISFQPPNPEFPVMVNFRSPLAWISAVSVPCNDGPTQLVGSPGCWLLQIRLAVGTAPAGAPTVMAVTLSSSPSTREIAPALRIVDGVVVAMKEPFCVDRRGVNSDQYGRTASAVPTHRGGNGLAGCIRGPGSTMDAVAMPSGGLP